MQRHKRHSERPEPHTAAELNAIKMDRNVISEAVKWLVSEEKVYIENGMVSLW